MRQGYACPVWNLGSPCRAAGRLGRVVVRCREHWKDSLAGKSCRISPTTKLAGNMMTLMEP